MVDIAIRELKQGDLASIAATDGGPAWNTSASLWDRYRDEQSRGERVILLAFDAEQAVGYGTLAWSSSYYPFQDAGIPEISNLVVAARARNAGIATRFIAEFEQRARAAGSTAIGIGVGLYADYGPAQRLYAKLGYQPDGKGVTYCKEPVTPGASLPVDDDLVLWMTKAL